MPAYGYTILVAGWLIWMIPFFLIRANRPKAQRLDRRARWGIAITAVGFALLWQSRFWEMQLPAWRLAPAIVFFALGSLLSWTATRALGRQWRMDAGLNADHQLITAGPYRVIRHPIYTSMLCMMIATGCIMTPFWLLGAALAFGIVGTEIRVRIEDGLLESRFGRQFEAYKRHARAYLPMIR